MPVERFRLTCLLWPDGKPQSPVVESIVVVELDNNDLPIMLLKDLIKGKYARRLHNVDACDLVFWKCSIPTDDNLRETLNSLSFNNATDTRLRRLPPADNISKHFLTVLPDGTLHGLVTVELPEIETVTPITLLSDLRNLREERQRFYTAFPVKRPSSQTTPSRFSKLQQKDNQKVVWSRPSAADATIPVTLLHPIFRQFVDDCENHQPIQQDNALVLELLAEMPRFFQSENARAAALRDSLTKHGIPLDTSTITFQDNHYPTDGAVTFNAQHLAIAEVKGEIGGKGAEPYSQVILYYTYATLAKAPSFSKFNFPALLITIFGPQISFCGAVWTTRPHFQVLTPALPLFCHHTDTNMRESLARHFGALKKAIRSLQNYYEPLTKPELLRDLDPLSPDPRTYRSLQTKSAVNFEYLHQIDEEKLLFIGETDNGEKICIKFVRRYSKAVHEKCAQMGIAPKLRGFEDIGAGWKMAVMDALDEEYQPFDRRNLPAGTEEHLRARLVELHQANFVHGDVRDVNIMVRKDGKPGFMLVDFDWSGVVGEVCYPINVNKVGLWRPNDASDGLLIKPDHDIAMLEHIFI